MLVLRRRQPRHTPADPLVPNKTVGERRTENLHANPAIHWGYSPIRTSSKLKHSHIRESFS